MQSASATGWETLYAGYRWDGDPSRMYYVRNRLLLPYAGTWNRRDPIGYVRSTSLTQYAVSQPLSLNDGLGLQPAPSRGSSVNDFWLKLSNQARDRRKQQVGQSPWDGFQFNRPVTESIAERGRNGTLGNGAGPNGETYCIPKVHNGVVGRGGGPVANNEYYSPPFPSFYDQFVWGNTDLNRDLTPWFDKRYPGHNEAARIKGRQMIENGIRSGSVDGLNGKVISSVIASNSKNDFPPTLVFGEDSIFASPPINSGEDKYGDKRQTPAEANVFGPGSFSYRLRDVQVTRTGENQWKYSAEVQVIDNLGISPGDALLPGSEPVIGGATGMRNHELWAPAQWRISGSCAR